VCLTFITDPEMKRMNRKYKGKNRPTDVLAFSQIEGVGPQPKYDCPLLGDVVISVDRARVQAPQYGNTFKKEFVLYIIHGILHLLGYKDYRLKDRKLMQAKEAELMRAVEAKYAL